MDTRTEPSMAVVEAVAAAEDVAPDDLTEPLFSSVDADALDALLDAGTVQVTFPYHGCAVTVDGNGTVDLTSLPTD